MLSNRCWRRLLRIPWAARRSNQSILKEISPEYSLEGLMLKLRLPILWPLDAKNWLIGNDPDAGKDWRWEEKGTTEDDGWMSSPTQWTWNWVSSGSWWWAGKPGVLQSMWSQSQTGLSDWTELTDLSHLLPWSTEYLTPPWTPSGVVGGQQLQQHRVQSPERQMGNAIVVQPLVMLLASASL